MRLFIAVDVPSLSDVQSKLKGAIVVKTKEFHVTLKFLGEVMPAVAKKVETALSEVRYSQFNSSFGSVDCFPSRSSPRVVWVGLEPIDEWKGLQREVDAVLASLFPNEKQFVPHATLARVKEVADKDSFLQSLKIKVPADVFKVSEFHLVESKLTKSGPIHKILAVFPLRPQPL